MDGNYSGDIGTPDKKGSLSIRGPLISKDDELFFPAPLDLVLLENKLIPLTLTQKPPTFISDYPLSYILLHKSEKHAKEPEGWFTEIEFLDYLKNQSTEYVFLKDKDLFLYEPKIGIAREKSTLTTKEGHLYRIPMIRVKEGCSLVVDVEGVNEMPTSGLIQLGGESKGALIEETDNKFEKLENIEFDIKDKLFKIYLATPAIFEKGWLPKWISEDSLEGEFNKIKLKLICCALGRYIPIGGWDIVEKRAKLLQRGVQAGSVYYFEILDNSNSKEIKEAFHLKNISDINPEEGFGLSIVGEVKL
jgi:CRISPR-associated protein Cmr3